MLNSEIYLNFNIVSSRVGIRNSEEISWYYRVWSCFERRRAKEMIASPKRGESFKQRRWKFYLSLTRFRSKRSVGGDGSRIVARNLLLITSAIRSQPAGPLIKCVTWKPWIHSCHGWNSLKFRYRLKTRIIEVLTVRSCLLSRDFQRSRCEIGVNCVTDKSIRMFAILRLRDSCFKKTNYKQLYHVIRIVLLRNWALESWETNKFHIHLTQIGWLPRDQR